MLFLIIMEFGEHMQSVLHMTLVIGKKILPANLPGYAAARSRLSTYI